MSISSTPLECFLYHPDHVQIDVWPLLSQGFAISKQTANPTICLLPSK